MKSIRILLMTLMIAVGAFACAASKSFTLVIDAGHGGHDSGAKGAMSYEKKPYPIEGLDWVNCSYDSPYGKIVSNWKRTGDKFEWTVEIPAGTTATALIPGHRSPAQKSKLFRPR